MKRPFLLLYINDFLGSPTVQAMDDNQFRWYLQLLMRAWQYEIPCHLPNTDEELMMYAGCKSAKQWQAKKGLVLSNFDLSDDRKHITNARLIAEYQKMCVISDKRAEAARVKAAKHLQNSANAELCKPDAVQNAATQTLTLTQTKPRTMSPKPATDERYKVFVDDLKKYWVSANRKALVEIPFAVSPADGKNIKTLLQRNPGMQRELWQICLQYRARSPAVVHSTPIYEWILSLLEYAHGPLDRFNKPEGSGQVSKVQSIARANASAGDEVRRNFGITRTTGQVLPDGDGPRALGAGRESVDEVPGGERKDGD